MAEMKLLNRFSWKHGFLETKQQRKSTIQDSMIKGVKKNKQGTCFNEISTGTPYLGELAMTMGTAISPITKTNTTQVDLSWSKGISVTTAHTNERDEPQRGTSTSTRTPSEKKGTGSKQNEPKTTQTHDTGNLHHASPTWGLPPEVLDKWSHTTTTLPSILEQATLFNQQELNQKSSQWGQQAPPKIESAPENQKGTGNDNRDRATNQGTQPNTSATRNQPFLQWYNLRICLYSKNQPVLSKWEALHHLLIKLQACNPTIQVYPWQSKDYRVYPPIQLLAQDIPFFDQAIYALRLTKQQACQTCHPYLFCSHWWPLPSWSIPLAPG